MSRHTPIPLALGRFKQLAQRSNDVWQGGHFKLPMWVGNPDGPGERPYRPVGGFWRSQRTGLIHLEIEQEQHVAPAQLALTALIEFGLRWNKDLGGRPARLEVTDPELRDALAEVLAPLNTPVDLVDDLPDVRDALRMLEATAGDGVRLPGLLEGKDITPERLRAFAEAAAHFYRQRPWEHLANEDLIVVEAPRRPKGLAHCSAMGHGGQQFGLAFFESRRDFERVIDADIDRALAMPGRAYGVTFSPPDETPFADLDAWEEYDLPVAGERAFPVPADMRSDGTFLRPDRAALNHMEALLRALAKTSEAELDAGRWQCRVETFDGPIDLTLALPHLLEAEADGARPPGKPDVWPRMAERNTLRLSRFLEGQSISTPEDLERALEEAHQRGFVDLDADAAAGRLLTTRERAQELAYDALESTGRLRIKRARQALALSEDCVDAWVILGDAAADPDAAIDHYRRAMDAGARVIGPERLAALTGTLWGHIEARPYLRARFALAQALDAAGRADEALDHHRALLELDPIDSLGVRQLLLTALLARGELDEAGRLLGQYPDDVGAGWAYGRALWSFRTEGDSTTSRAALAAAVRTNPHVAKFLTAPESMPLAWPSQYALGSREEAVVVADWWVDAFEASAGAMAWLRRHAPAPRRRSSGTRGGGKRSRRR